MTTKQKRTATAGGNGPLMDWRALRSRIAGLAEDAEVADAFEEDLVRLGLSDQSRRWYSNQKEHWLGWLKEYDGPGYYGRKVSEAKRTARHVYVRAVNPAMLLWLVDASGVSRDTVEAARHAAVAVGEAKKSNRRGVYASQSGAIRKIVSWEMVENALERRESMQAKEPSVLRKLVKAVTGA